MIQVRPIWKGYLTFGLVTIPVKLYPATEEKDIHFRLLHQSCGTPIKNIRYCPACDREVPWEEIIRGYEFARGQFVTLTQEELASLPLENSGAVHILSFADLEEIDPIYFDKSYYLSPDEGGGKAYVLLQEALRDTKRVAIGKLTFREKDHLVAVRPYKQGLLLSTLYYNDEIRDMDQIPEMAVEATVHPNERKMAVQLIESLTEPFRPESYTDQYREALLQMIQSKAEGMKIPAREAKRPEKVVDLMEALRRSLEQARRSKEVPKLARQPQPKAGAMRERHR